MGTPTKVGNRNTRSGATRGISADPPAGWSTPEPAERLASFAKGQGWVVASEWLEGEGPTRLKVELGRVLRPGEIKTTKGDRWIYRLIWEEVPEGDRPNPHYNRMRIVVCRALTPSTGVWRDGPSLKMISDMVSRNPAPKRASMAVQAVRLEARARTMAL